MGLKVLPPDINESMSDFSVVGGQHIRFGLAAVKNVGIGAIESIISVREKDGNFRSIVDFCERIDSRKVNKRVIESLIKCGAFDGFGKSRKSLFLSLDAVTERVHLRQREKTSAQANIFSDIEGQTETSESTPEDVAPDLPEWDQRELLAYEKDTLGFYITGHPLDKYMERLKALVNADSELLDGLKDKDPVSIAGVVSSLREIKTKRKDTMAYVVMEDLKGSFECIFFSDVYHQAYDILHGDEPILIKGTVDVGEETTKVIAAGVERLDEFASRPVRSVHFHISANCTTVELLERLRMLLVREYPGHLEAYLHFHDDRTETVVSLGGDMRIACSTRLREAADRLLGRSGATVFQ